MFNCDHGSAEEEALKSCQLGDLMSDVQRIPSSAGFTFALGSGLRPGASRA